MNKKLLADSKLVFQRCPGIQITFNSTSKLSSTKLLFLFGRFTNCLKTKDARNINFFRRINKFFSEGLLIKLAEMILSEKP